MNNLTEFHGILLDPADCWEFFQNLGISLNILQNYSLICDSISQDLAQPYIVLQNLAET